LKKIRKFGGWLQVFLEVFLEDFEEHGDLQLLIDDVCQSILLLCSST
jgi:hypothetical protein